MTWVPVLGAEHSVLLAGLCCQSTWEAGIARARYEAGWHSLSAEDAERVRGAPPARFAERATEAAAGLLTTARRVAATGGREDREDREDEAAALGDYIAAVGAAAPFALLAPLVPGLTPPPEVNEAAAEVRAFYRIALAVLADEEALELFRSTSPQIALRKVEESFPALRASIGEHLDAYAWLRTRAYRLPPLSPRELLERIQGVVLRWDPAAVRAAAGPELRGSPLLRTPVELRGSDDVLRRALNGHALLQAECIARPFFARLAEELSCTLEQLLFADPIELVAAVAGGTALPVGASARRYGEGFSVYREGAGQEVHTGGPFPFRHTLLILPGMTACRGAATGPVRVILDAGDLDRLQAGDVLVSAASTTDWASGPTVFPTRGGGPEAVGRAAAVVTDEGGLLSHAAVVCRERGIPCILATERATELLSDGMVVEVDATQPTGRVVVLDLPAGRPAVAG